MHIYVPYIQHSYTHNMVNTHYGYRHKTHAYIPMFIQHTHHNHTNTTHLHVQTYTCTSYVHTEHTYAKYIYII